MLEIATIPLAIEGLPTTMHAMNQNKLKFLAMDSRLLYMCNHALHLCSQPTFQIEIAPCKGQSSSTTNVIVFLNMVTYGLRINPLFTPASSRDRSSPPPPFFCSFLQQTRA